MSSDSPPIPEWARSARAQWAHTGRTRPPFAKPTGPGQESVWDYPRPPRIEKDAREVLVQVDGTVLARSVRSLRVLETASPPTFYIPLADVHLEWLRPAAGGSRCEWKGLAQYWTVSINGRELPSVGWSYPEPLPGFEAIAQAISFYPSRVECLVGQERVRPQPGSFYGGWITSEVIGPFKGEPGSGGW